MQSFRDTIQDLTDSINKNDMVTGEDEQSCFEKLIATIKCTMSDQGSVNPCFNKQLQILRDSFLPNVIENWNDISTEKKVLYRKCVIFFAKCIYC